MIGNQKHKRLVSNGCTMELLQKYFIDSRFVFVDLHGVKSRIQNSRKDFIFYHNCYFFRFLKQFFRLNAIALERLTDTFLLAVSKNDILFANEKPQDALFQSLFADISSFFHECETQKLH